MKCTRQHWWSNVEWRSLTYSWRQVPNLSEWITNQIHCSFDPPMQLHFLCSMDQHDQYSYLAPNMPPNGGRPFRNPSKSIIDITWNYRWASFNSLVCSQDFNSSISGNINIVFETRWLGILVRYRVRYVADFRVRYVSFCMCYLVVRESESYTIISYRFQDSRDDLLSMRSPGNRSKDFVLLTPTSELFSCNSNK